MISISTLNFDSTGNVIIDEDEWNSRLAELSPRLSRQATLDGGCSISNSGLSHSDRTFKVRATIDSDQKALLDYIASNATLVQISCSEGFFLGAVSYIDTSTQRLTMDILIKSKET